ncbi:hypothetical protein P4G44_20160 [Shigella boydii]|nr:hypothetical protein [Shigella boydii]MDS1505183.1 hypothetical protein [Shigella boydii]
MFLRQLAEIGTVLNLLEKIQSQFLFFYKDMQCSAAAVFAMIVP